MTLRSPSAELDEHVRDDQFRRTVLAFAAGSRVLERAEEDEPCLGLTGVLAERRRPLETTRTQAARRGSGGDEWKQDQNEGDQQHPARHGGGLLIEILSGASAP